MNQSAYKIVISAGEASGDSHAAALYRALQRFSGQIRALGMGGKSMRDAGIEIRVDSSSMGVIGLVEILKHYGEIRRALRDMKALVRDERPDLLICVDYKEFNLKLAQYAKKQGIKVLFYVSPQVWAWRPGRVVTYGKAIDMMAVIFPFETAYYEAEGVPVRYVGHPSVDKVIPTMTRSAALQQFGLDAAKPVVGLLPGSRANEIKRMLPVMLQTVELLASRHPNLQFVLPQADSISDAMLEPYLGVCSVPIVRIAQRPYDVMQCCDAIMTTSGTASLEIALLGVPMVIAYRLAAFSYWLGKQLVNIAFIGLPNIIAGRSVVKELIQHDVTPENLASELERLLWDEPYRSQVQADLREVKRLLGEGGGTENMAQLAWSMLTGLPGPDG